LRIAVVGFMEYSPVSQRGICVLTTALAEQGHDVTFITFPSYFWHLKNRKSLTKEKKIYVNKTNYVKNRTRMTLVPYSKRIPSFLRKIFIKQIEKSHAKTLMKEKLDAYDLVIIESGKAVMAVDYINPKKLIYRQSDPIEYGLDKTLTEFERKIIKKSNLILVVNKLIQNLYLDRYPELANRIVLWENGFYVPFSNSKSPYNEKINAVYFGLFPVDWSCLDLLSRAIPELTIHVIGPHKKPKNISERIISHGFLPHEKILPYVEHSNVCLVPYKNLPSRLQISEMTSKILTYMYYQKPIVASPFYGSERLAKYGVLVSSTKSDFVSKVRYVLKMNSKRVIYDINFNKYTIEARKQELITILKKKNII